MNAVILLLNIGDEVVAFGFFFEVYPDNAIAIAIRYVQRRLQMFFLRTA